MELLKNPQRRDDPRSRWIWAERALLLIGILCLGIFGWSWLDARLLEIRENERLELALTEALTEARTEAASRPPKPVASTASETDSFASLQQGAERIQREEKEKPEPLPAPGEGELVGRIAIPRIGVSAIVLEGVGRRTLRRGAGHIPATPLPVEGEGNVGIAAHRDSYFRALKDIREDDTIELTTLDGTFHYTVEWTRIVEPEDVSVLAPTDEPALTLVTCYPFYYVGSAPKRFIVRARRIEGEEEPG